MIIDHYVIFASLKSESTCKAGLLENQIRVFRYQNTKLASRTYVESSLAMSTSVLEALSGKLDIKRHSPSILYIWASLTMSTSVLKALPGKLDIKRHSPSNCILYITASLAMSTSILKALPGTLDIKRHSPSILYIWASLAMSTSVPKALPSKLDIKDTHLVTVFSISRQASQCQQAFSKLCLVPLISIDTPLVFAL